MTVFALPTWIMYAALYISIGLLAIYVEDRTEFIQAGKWEKGNSLALAFWTWPIWLFAFGVVITIAGPVLFYRWIRSDHAHGSPTS